MSIAGLRDIYINQKGVDFDYRPVSLTNDEKRITKRLQIIKRFLASDRHRLEMPSYLYREGGLPYMDMEGWNMTSRAIDGQLQEERNAADQAQAQPAAEPFADEAAPDAANLEIRAAGDETASAEEDGAGGDVTGDETGDAGAPDDADDGRNTEEATEEDDGGADDAPDDGAEAGEASDGGSGEDADEGAGDDAAPVEETAGGAGPEDDAEEASEDDDAAGDGI
jgi:hypothetical protein